MEWTSLNDIREKYLSFFESKGHLRLPSFSLVPNNDKSLLLINSGMAPMKKYFTGEVTPPRSRVTTCQKCIRTPDIEQVGKTARHGTFFEMLGNFSFGDYFKKEATAWAWEFCTEVLEMPVDKLYVTIYENDDEAFEIWTKQNGVDPSHIVRLGKEDNFWEHGSGPCGPCSEIYFDRGEKYGCGSPDCGPGCECDRFTEFWNNVFSQFNNDGNGNYTELAQKNIDTGMGLERLACIMQGVDNIFEVDTVQNTMKKISEIAGVKYHDDAKNDVSLRVITDHVRSSTFMIGDGVIPSNNGRGYVLRRLIRRACRHGRLLGVNEPFLYKVCETVLEDNKVAYPELQDKAELIKKVILSEEESFGKTIDAGLARLDEYIENTEGTVFSGEDAFKLNDTFGFPLDLTKDVLEERGMTVDEEKFNELLANQKATARAARKDAGADAWKNTSVKIDAEKTVFTGYTDFTAEAKVLALVNADGELVDMLGAGEKGSVVLDKTPFYATSGGQVADTGVITADGVEFDVEDTSKNADGIYIHSGTVKEGVVSVGNTVNAQIDADRRKSIMRNHTAAHLLQAALREVLGTHVEQAGQLVNDKEVRFDFTHFNPLTTEELSRVEAIVNKEILACAPVSMQEMPIEEAKKMGAMMLFGEKYGNIVRVVKAGDASTEFCGGTHVASTGELGLFKIVSEASVAAGVRRIVALTGTGVLNYLNECEDTVKFASATFKSADNEVKDRITAIVAENKAKDKEIQNLNAEMTKLKSADMFSSAVDVDGLELYTAKVEGTTPDALRSMGDDVKTKGDNVVAVLAGVNGDKANFVAVCGKGAIAKGVKAGDLVKEVAKIANGGGGGRPDSAMAGAKDITKIDEALSKAEEIVKSLIK
ncbi:alanine--tRNA ligase [Eubacterium coprostanoligenes]|uniref:alanine--tRNA ligase n=1 Tax=Eubacterium coprostanoligenes TaxID=290054 RepID=UPI00235507AA|nr:alanine--tRNA ligase [Eubacterium coprostanoligenes]MCI6254968.1 alanine--tRNA ligase [Eubacterium coprostanoligenes]MDY5400263.1 alanine--tRNA ligase [Eubacterium coprostanoligenes]